MFVRHDFTRVLFNKPDNCYFTLVTKSHFVARKNLIADMPKVDEEDDDYNFNYEMMMLHAATPSLLALVCVTLLLMRYLTMSDFLRDSCLN